MNREQRAKFLLKILMVCLPVTMAVSVGSGAIPISLTDSLWALLDAVGLKVKAVDPYQQMILFSIRWPRTLLSALVGATLAICGAAMQGLFRNPLADPTLVGVSSGASVGASVAIVLGATLLSGMETFFGSYGSWVGAYLVSMLAFVGGLIATLVVYRLGTSQAGTSVVTMLLAGIAISALASALTNIFTYIADDVALRRLSLWHMGSLDGADWQRVGVSFTLMGVVLWMLPAYSKALNAMLLGESEARHLGVNVERVKVRLILLTALGVGVSVSVAGIIGFVGLVVPHLIRLMMGPDHRYLMPASALLGAALLVAADALSRTLLAPAEIPIGIVTALLGAPFFISLLLQQRQRMLVS